MAHRFGLQMLRILFIIKYFAQLPQNPGSQGLLFPSHRNIVSLADADQLRLGQNRKFLYILKFYL